MTPIYAIGDVHGHLDKLQEALALIEAEGGKDAKIVLIGDYVDRGPDSKGVIDFLIAAQQAKRNWVLLKGNHDRYFQRFMENQTIKDPCTPSGLHWMNERLGGDKTLASYGVAASEGGRMSRVHEATLKAVPTAHLEFLQNLAISHETEDQFFAHAGIKPSVPFHKQSEDDLLWIRKPFIESTLDHGKLVVHGHTAIDAPMHYGNRVNLDGGTGYGRPLFPAVFEGRKCWLLTKGGRVSL